MGEFGRDYSGNNHYAKAWTTLFAGGGVRGGQIIGRTDAKGMTVEDRPVSVADFAATVFNVLGIDYKKEYHVAGRPIGMVDGKVNPVDELFA
jgi:arylsulfatase A-like enzyme